MKFCDNHKIRYNDDAVTKASHYFVKYKDVKDPDLDKSFFYPSYTFFYINFKGNGISVLEYFIAFTL